MPDGRPIQIFISGRAVKVPMRQFNRQKGGVKLCRWFSCEKYPKHPFREYCSQECQNEFFKWYYRLFSWYTVCREVWRRDKGHCRMCKKDLRDPGMARRAGYTIDSMPPDQYGRFEFDHIIPVSVAISKLGYKQDFKFVREILHNPRNLRLLCFDCHKQVTAAFTAKLFRKRDPEKMKILQEKALEIFSDWFIPEKPIPIENTLLPYLEN